MGLISYHRAGFAKRQVRAGIQASRRLGSELRDVQTQNSR